MPLFNWSATPRYGTCLTCGSSSADIGFVDTFVEVNVRREMGGAIQGVVDAIFCGNCLVDAARLVGAASRQEVEGLVQDIHSKEQENEKLRDEVQAWTERFNALATASASELKAFADQQRAENAGTPAPK